MNFKTLIKKSSGFVVVSLMTLSFTLSEETADHHMPIETPSAPIAETSVGDVSENNGTAKDDGFSDSFTVPETDRTSVMKDGFAMFGSLAVGPNETRKGDMVVFGGAADVAGVLTGDLVVFGGTAKVSGHVTGDVVAIGGIINLGSNARVDGDVTAVGGVIHREDGALVRGQSVSVGTGGVRLGSDFQRPDLRMFRYGYKLSVLLTWLVFSFIIALVFTRPVENTVETAIKRPVESIFAGFVFHVAILLTCLVLTVIVIGIPLAILGVFLWLIISIFGTASGFVLMGRLVMNKFNRDASGIIVVLVTGFIILAVIRQAPFFVGWSIWQLWGMTGTGATVLSRFGSNKPWFGGRQPRYTPVNAPARLDSNPASIPSTDTHDSQSG